MDKTRIVVLATTRNGAMYSNVYWTSDAAEGAAEFLRDHNWDVVLLYDVRPETVKPERQSKPAVKPDEQPKPARVDADGLEF